MSEEKNELAKLLHDFKSPLSSTRMGLIFMLEGRAGAINGKAQQMLKDMLGRTQKLLDKIQEFEDNHG